MSCSKYQQKLKEIQKKLAAISASNAKKKKNKTVDELNETLEYLTHYCQEFEAKQPKKKSATLNEEESLLAVKDDNPDPFPSPVPEDNDFSSSEASSEAGSSDTGSSEGSSEGESSSSSESSNESSFA